VHRDLKPANIMIDKRGEPIVMDFGVACWFDDKTQTRLTRQGVLVGTPAYMSPEQIEGHTKLGPASDIYSLGVVLYELLAGRCPFEGTVLNVISQVLYQTPPDPRKFRTDLSPGLVEIIQRAMKKDPSQRFPTMRDFAKALTAFINGTSPEEDEGEEEKEENRESPLPEPIFEARPKRERRREDALSAALPPRSDVRAKAKKKSKNGIPLGIGVVAATTFVVLGVLIGAFLVGNRNTPKTPTSTQNPPETTELAAATGGVSTPSNPSSPAPPSGSSAQAASAPIPKPTNPLAPLAQNDRASAGSETAPKNRAPATVASSSSGAGTQQAAPSNSKSSPRSQANTPEAAAIASSQPMPAPKQTRNDAGPPAKDAPDAPDPPPPRRGSRPQADDDNPPPPREAGRVPFDGGPKRGTSIEQYFQKLDTNHDGRLDPTELPLHIIYRADTNKDGELTLSELKQAYKKRGQRLFSPPTAAEMRRLPQGAPPPAGGGPPGGGPPAQRTGGL
jgi:serine/threonine protein kinase